MTSSRRRSVVPAAILPAVLAAGIAGALPAAPAAAQAPDLDEYLVGEWGLGGPSSCGTASTVRFARDGAVRLYDTYSGAWRVEGDAVRLELAARTAGQPGALISMRVTERRADGFAASFDDGERRWAADAFDCAAAEDRPAPRTAAWVFNALPAGDAPLPVGEARIAAADSSAPDSPAPDSPAAVSIQCWAVPAPLVVVEVTPPPNSRAGAAAVEAGPAAVVFEVTVEDRPRRFVLPMRAVADGPAPRLRRITLAEEATGDLQGLIAALQNGTRFTVSRAAADGDPALGAFDLRNSFQAIDAALRHGGCLDAMR